MHPSSFKGGETYSSLTSCASGTVVWFCCAMRAEAGMLWGRACGTGVAGAETVLDGTNCAEG